MERTPSLENYLDQMPDESLTGEDYAALCADIRAAQETRRALSRRSGHPSSQEASVLAAGRRAETVVVRANLRLVVAFAKKHKSAGLPLDDLIQAGNLGLIQASTRFDDRRGFRFSTYAHYWVMASIRETLCRTRNIIRLPRDLDARVGRYRRGDGSEDVAAVRDLDRLTSVVSLSGDSEPRLPASDAAVEDLAIASAHSAEVVAALDVLDPRSRELIVLRYGLDGGEPVKVNDLAERYRLTRERIRQIHNAALATLRADPSVQAMSTVTAGDRPRRSPRGARATHDEGEAA